MPELVSIREFARRVAVSDQTIRNMLAAGKLSEKCVTGEGRSKKIKFEQALTEYNKIGGATHAAEYTGSNRSNRAASHLGNIEDLSGVLLKEAEIKMRLLRSEQAYRQKQGELVEASSVYKKLFEFGKELREAAQAIPAQVVADIVSADGDEHKIRTILDIAIHKVLERMADIETRTI